MIQALNRALGEEMERDERVMVLGEDVGRAGGVFRVTDRLQERFGEERVVDTPLAESAIVGTSIGLAIGGMLPVAEIQFQGFAWYAFHQIENHLARVRWRSRGKLACPVVVRMPYGAGIHALEHHSESRESYFIHTPGLKVVVPRSPTTARALLKASVRDADPVIFLEPAAL
jgi:pyruvate dehydrogenase E1 component beta subunit